MATLMIVVISDAKFHFRKLSSSLTAAHAHTCVLDSPEFIYNEMTDFFRGFREVCCLLLMLVFFFGQVTLLPRFELGPDFAMHFGGLQRAVQCV